MPIDRGTKCGCIAQAEYCENSLRIAIRNGDIEIVKMLLHRGANIDPVNMFAVTPLHSAVESKNMEIVELLLNQGANVNARDFSSSTPLLLAAEEGSEEIVKLLLKHGACVNSAYTSAYREGDTALCLAVKGRHEKVVQLLLECGANVDGKDKFGKTVLHTAVENDNIEIVKMLIDRGANVGAKDTYGDTVLHYAVETGHSVIVEHVLKHCPDVNYINTKDTYRRTALHIASVKGHKQIVIALLEHGSDINIMSEDHKTPLDVAKASFSLFYNEVASDDFNIADILKRHVVKMKTANLFVSKRNLLSISNNDERSDFQNGCEEEIATMKSEKVGNANVSFYDILTKDISQSAKYAGNDSIVQILRSDDYKIKFPIYASMINSNFRKGEIRKELLEQGNNIFYFLFNSFPQLSHDCTERIFIYLSVEDLRILIDACKPVSVSSPNGDINNVVIT